MKLSAKEIQEIISQTAGEDIIPLVNLLRNKKNVSEFKLAEDLKETVNAVRNKLYRLHNANLVSFIRKKDKQKGWYIYYWTLNTSRARFLFFELKKQKIIQLKERLEREQENQFYICPNKCMRLDFDQAMNFEFKCPECGKLINLEDNKEKITAIKQEIENLEKEIKQQLKIKKSKPASKKKIIKKKVKKKTRAKKIKKKAGKKRVKKKQVKKHRKKIRKKRIKKKVKKTKK